MHPQLSLKIFRGKKNGGIDRNKTYFAFSVISIKTVN
jgi:hypothetical protein